MKNTGYYLKNKTTYCFDLDGTLCSTNGNDYKNALPIELAIQEVNRLYDDGNIIKIFTARGTSSKVDYTELTTNQLKDWGLKYHELIMNVKPHFDIFIDDRAVNALDWLKSIFPNPQSKGLVAGSFDLIHPGYIKMFEEAKSACDYLIVALHTQPVHKNKLVHTVEERKIILSAIKYIDEIVTYDTEDDLYNLLKTSKIDIRILSEEYRDTKYTGYDLHIPVYYNTRRHDWSTSSLKEKIKAI